MIFQLLVILVQPFSEKKTKMTITYVFLQDVVKAAQEEVNKQKALLKECDKDIGQKVAEQKNLQKEGHTAEIKIKELENKISKMQKDSNDAARLVS